MRTTLKAFYVTVHCLTVPRRDLVVELLPENEILLTEESTTYYDMNNEDYCIVIHPHASSTGKLDRLLANARAIGLIASYKKQTKE